MNDMSFVDKGSCERQKGKIKEIIRHTNVRLPLGLKLPVIVLWPENSFFETALTPRLKDRETQRVKGQTYLSRVAFGRHQLCCVFKFSTMVGGCIQIKYFIVI